MSGFGKIFPSGGKMESEPSNFDRCLPIIFDHEGTVFEDDPDDSGGATKYGVAINEDGLALTRLLGRAPTVDDIRNLSATQAASIIKSDYWDKMNLDAVESFRIAICMIDMGYVQGFPRVVERAQSLVGCPMDGVCGPKTTAMLNITLDGLFVKAFLDLSAQRFRDIAANNPKDQKYLSGWLNRVEDLRRICSQ